MKYTRLVGGKWQLDCDRQSGCARLFESHTHAAHAALFIHVNKVRKIMKGYEKQQRVKMLKMLKTAEEAEAAIEKGQSNAIAER